MNTETPIDRCRRYRRRILEISMQVPAAHVAPAFSCVEMVDALYHSVMGPSDIFIMSKGHGYLAQLVVLEDLGLVSRAEMDLYCKPGGRLGGHPDYQPDLGIHASTGSLGHGLGLAAGQALAERLKHSSAKVYVLLSDGECQEGSTWEAAMVAANLRLTRLTALVDYNGWGGMEPTNSSTGSFPTFKEWLAAKWVAFGWEVAPSVKGHSFEAVTAALRDHRTIAPLAVICHTVKGKGVSFIEDGQPLWHYRSPSPEEYRRALEELG